MRMFFVAGIGIAIFIEFLLISKKNKTVSDQILTLWMFLILLHQFLLYIFITEDVYRFPFLLGLEHPLPLLQGVFLFLYVSFLTNQLPENRKVLLLHFVPAAAMYLYLMSFFMLPSDQKLEVYRNRGAGYETFMIVRLYAVTFSGILYVAWSAFLLRKHRKNIQDQFSDLERVNLQILVGGGVRNLDDLVKLKDLGIFGVLLATALHSGKIKVEEITRAGLTMS